MKEHEESVKNVRKVENDCEECEEWKQLETLDSQLETPWLCACLPCVLASGFAEGRGFVRQRDVVDVKIWRCKNLKM